LKHGTGGGVKDMAKINGTCPWCKAKEGFKVIKIKQWWYAVRCTCTAQGPEKPTEKEAKLAWKVRPE